MRGRENGERLGVKDQEGDNRGLNEGKDSVTQDSKVQVAESGKDSRTMPTV